MGWIQQRDVNMVQQSIQAILAMGDDELVTAAEALLEGGEPPERSVADVPGGDAGAAAPEGARRARKRVVSSAVAEHVTTRVFNEPMDQLEAKGDATMLLVQQVLDKLAGGAQESAAVARPRR